MNKEIMNMHNADHLVSSEWLKKNKGKWICREVHGDAGMYLYNEYKCSCCGDTYSSEGVEYDFCPWCGADMRGE